MCLEVCILNQKVVALLLMFVVLLAGCETKDMSAQSDSEQYSEVTSTIQSSLTENESQTGNANDVGGNPMAWNGIGEITDESAYVSTPYGDIYYPVEYADLLNVDITEADSYSVAFSGRSSVGDVFLFIVYFGADDHGETIGTYEENGDTLSVTCQMCDLNLDDRWNDEEKQQLEEEQTAVSAYVIENLTRLQGFTAIE